MARQRGILPFTGSLGDKVGYYRHGKYFTRRRPVFVRQTLATKLAAKDFGTASKGAALLRRALGGRYDDGLITRLNKRFAELMREDAFYAPGERKLNVSNMQGFAGFGFNVAGRVGGDVLVREENGSVCVSYSGERGHGLKGVTHFVVRAIVASVNFERGAVEVVSSLDTLVERGKPFACELKVDGLQGAGAARKGMRIVLMEVRSYMGEVESGNKQGYALEVVGVLPPVEIEVRREFRNKAPMLKVIPAYDGLRVERFVKFPMISVKFMNDLSRLSSLIEDH